MGHWNRHFPTWVDANGRTQYSHWGNHFPEDPPIGVVQPVPPSGVEAGALILDVGVTVTWTWITGMHKAHDGAERRSSHVDDPAMRVEGKCLLVDDGLRRSRAQLARYAARGEPFLFGLPWEALAIRAPSPDSTIAVFTTARADWALPGMRVLVHHRDYGSKFATIQEVGADSIEVDVALGVVGKLGAMVMPAMPLFLDAQQAFNRYPDGKTEHWQLKARNASAGFARQALAARLALEAPQTNGGALDGAWLQAVVPGTGGNAIEVTQSDDALTSGGELEEDVEAQTLHIKYMGDVTTVEEYAALLEGSALVRLLGDYDGEDVLAAADDEFTATNLSGGTEVTPAEMGLGATVTTYRDRPAWERGIDVEGAVTDSLQSMATPQDLGGLPFVVTMTEQPDGGRMINVSGPLGPAWQYFKRFLWTVCGSFRSFWLSAERYDLVPTAVGAGTLTVTEADISAWYPAQRQDLEIRTAAGSIVRARIASRAGNVLSIVDEDDEPISLGAVPKRVSWLEACRLEGDAATVTFTTLGFSASLQARAVQQ